MQRANVCVRYDSNGYLILLSVKGHSGIAKIGVGLEQCIALSTLTQSMVFALNEFIAKTFFKCSAKSGDFLFEADLNMLDSDRIKDYNLITKSYLVNIKKLSKEYEEYIKYTEE